MKHEVRFNAQQQQNETSPQSQEAASAEFPSVEEMLRFDAAQTAVPPGVEEKLRRSAADVPSPRPWWRRLLGG